MIFFLKIKVQKLIAKLFNRLVLSNPYVNINKSAKKELYMGLTTYAYNSCFYDSTEIVNMQNDRSKITIGEHSHIRGQLVLYKHGGTISIGDYCYLGESSRIWSSKSIIIGNRVLISHNVNIHDNNGHPVDKQSRHEHYKQIITNGFPKEDRTLIEKNITIEDDVWIGFNAIILKGVTIGKGSIIAAGTVITMDVPPNSIVVGNPQKIVKTINN